MTPLASLIFSLALILLLVALFLANLMVSNNKALEEEKELRESEFRARLTYCLALFLAHEHMYRNWWEREEEPPPPSDFRFEMSFSRAADHLHELDVNAAPTELRDRIDEFRTKCLGLRLSMGGKQATKEDYLWVIKEAKELIRLIDEANGVDTIKAVCE